MSSRLALGTQILQTAKAEQEQAARELEEKRSEAERRVKDLAPAVEGIKGLDEVSQQWAARP